MIEESKYWNREESLLRVLVVLVLDLSVDLECIFALEFFKLIDCVLDKLIVACLISILVHSGSVIVDQRYHEND